MEFRIPRFVTNWLLHNVVPKAKETPYFHLDGYMNRWFVSPRDRENYRRGRHVKRIHEILRSDDDRDLHDHPFDYCTVILSGGYWEERPVDPAKPAGDRITTWKPPGSVIIRKAFEPHRLILPEGQPCVTLFMTSGRKKQWGFYTPEGWKYWRDYLKIPAHLNSASVPIEQDDEPAKRAGRV